MANDPTLAEAAAHYLHHADITPTVFRARLAAHGADPEFTNDTGVYLIDPEQAEHPTALVNRRILWSDRQLDLPYAQRAYDISPSNPKQRTIEDIQHRLLHKTVQCPIYRADNENSQLCEHHLDVTATCPLHGRPVGV